MILPADAGWQRRNRIISFTTMLELNWRTNMSHLVLQACLVWRYFLVQVTFSGVFNFSRNQTSLHSYPSFFIWLPAASFVQLKRVKKCLYLFVHVCMCVSIKEVEKRSFFILSVLQQWTSPLYKEIIWRKWTWFIEIQIVTNLSFISRLDLNNVMNLLESRFQWWQRWTRWKFGRWSPSNKDEVKMWKRHAVPLWI